MPAVIQEPERRSIGELEYSSDVLESMEKIHSNFEVSHRGSSLVFDSDGKDLGLDTECNFFPGINFDFLNGYLDDSRLEDRGEGSKGFLYRIYDIPEKYTKIIGAVFGVSCNRYHRVFLQTPDGIVNHDFGECVADLT